MKAFLVLFLLLSFSTLAFSQPVVLKDHKWGVTDIAFRRFKKEVLHQGLNKDFPSTHVSAYEFLRNQKIHVAKIFLFHTTQTVGESQKWYRVLPVINEHHKLYVLDPAQTAPKLVQEWLPRTTCKEIRRGDPEIELIFKEELFPETFPCYYHIAPAGYSTPDMIAKNLSGQGFERNSIVNEDVLAACIEAIGTPLGRLFGISENRCEEYLKFQ